MQEIELTKIKPNSQNPRKNFKGRAFEELTASIKTMGILQPIIVRPFENGNFQIITGERRFKAAQKAALKTIPAIIKEMTDDEAFDAMTIENLQREDLTGPEEAKSFANYIGKNDDDSINQLADRTGLNPGYIRKRIAIIQILPAKVIKAWADDELKIGHLEQLIRIDDKDERDTVTEELLDYGFSVQRLKEHITFQKPQLSKAKFNKSDCQNCFYNTEKQKTMFDLDAEDKIQCLKPECFKQKLAEHFKAKWPAIAKKEELKTNDFEFKFDVNWSDYETFSGPLYSGCSKCEHYKSLIMADGTVHTKRACLNPDCYTKKKAKKKHGIINPITVDPKIQKQKNRSIKHGTQFREEFYKEALPEKYKSINEEQFTRLAVFAFLKTGSYRLRNWFEENFFKNSNYSGHNIEALAQLDLGKLKEILNQMVIHQIMSNDCWSEDRKAVADHIGIDLSKEWLITEDYLKAKTKAEITEIVKTFDLVDKNRIEDFKQLKKDAMIKKVLSIKNLQGVVPKEILS